MNTVQKLNTSANNILKSVHNKINIAYDIV